MADPDASLSIAAKGTLKMMNLSTFGMKISWPKIMFECCPSTQIYALRTPLFIYASKTRI